MALSNIVLPSWRPKKRNVVYQERPEWVPEWVYTEAMAAKKSYNEDWEFWVWEEAKAHNCSQAIAEDACIRGLKKAMDRVEFVYGPRVGKWYKEYLGLDSLMRQVRHPIYAETRLGDKVNG